MKKLCRALCTVLISFFNALKAKYITRSMTMVNLLLHKSQTNNHTTTFFIFNPIIGDQTSQTIYHSVIKFYKQN